MVKNHNQLTKVIGDLEEGGGRGKVKEQLALFKLTAVGIVKVNYYLLRKQLCCCCVRGFRLNTTKPYFDVWLQDKRNNQWSLYTVLWTPLPLMEAVSRLLMGTV